MSSHTLITQLLNIGSDIWDLIATDAGPHQGNTLTYTLHDAVRLRGERRRNDGSPECLRRTPLPLNDAAPLPPMPVRLGRSLEWGCDRPDSVTCRGGWRMLIVPPHDGHSRHIVK